MKRITDLLQPGRTAISCEMFPPKPGQDPAPIREALRGIAATAPDFISVTYGAGGSDSTRTMELAEEIQRQYRIPALAHLTAISSSRAQIDRTLHTLREHGIGNILALRGDRPPDWNPAQPRDFSYAYPFIEEIRRQGDFCIGAGCYPEGHSECPDWEQGLAHLKQKVDCGCDFLITQLCFNNERLYRFFDRARAKGIDVPIVVGILPLTRKQQVESMCRLCGVSLPPQLASLVERFGGQPESMKQAGLAYATEQILELIANGVSAIHLYIMNQPEIARCLRDNLSHVVPAGT